jgi:hypothetical protein
LHPTKVLLGAEVSDVAPTGQPISSGGREAVKKLHGTNSAELFGILEAQCDSVGIKEAACSIQLHPTELFANPCVAQKA